MTASDSRKKRALILQGGWDGHEPEQTTRIFASKLRERGFDVDVADDLAVLEDGDRLSAYALIVPNWTAGVGSFIPLSATRRPNSKPIRT